MNIIKSLVRRITGRVDFSAAGKDALYAVLDQLRKYSSHRPRQNDISTLLIHDDIVIGDLMPVAVAIVALKKGSFFPDYLQGSGFGQLCEQAAGDMAHAHEEASAVVTRMMPQLPGLTVTAGHGIGEAQSLAGGKITSALNQISSGRSLLPIDTALLNLCNLMGEKMKINRFDAMKIYENL